MPNFNNPDSFGTHFRDIACFANGKPYPHTAHDGYVIGTQSWWDDTDGDGFADIATYECYIRYTFITSSTNSGITLGVQFTPSGSEQLKLSSGTQPPELYCAISTDPNQFLDITTAPRIHKLELTPTSNNQYIATCTNLQFDYLEPSSTYYLWIYPRDNSSNPSFKWNSGLFSSEPYAAYYVTDPHTHIISYNANGGKVDTLPPNQEKIRQVQLELSSTIPQRDGYTFQGWALSPDGAPFYQPSQKIDTDADMTLYAVWSLNGMTLKKYKTYIRANNGTGKACKAYIRGADNTLSTYKPTINAPSLTVSLLRAGNTSAPCFIFYGADPLDFNLFLQKNDNFAQFIKLKITVKNTINYTQQTIINKERILVPATGYRKIDLKNILTQINMTQDYGMYAMQIDIYADTQTEHLFNTITYPFYRVNNSPIPYLADKLIGMNIHFQNTNAAITQNMLDLLSTTGTGVWRASLPWASVEKNKGEFALPNMITSAIDYSIGKGIKPLIILAYGNDTIYGPPNPNNKEWLDAYVNYCTYVVSQLKGKVTHFEIWNEWNHASMSKVPANYIHGDDYAKVLVAASKAIKQANPDAYILCGATAGVPTTWIDQMLKNSNNLANVDAFSFHTYPRVDNTFVSPIEYNYAQYFSQVKNLLEPYKPNCPIWLTETGWPTHIGDSEYTGVTEVEAAAHLTALYIRALASMQTYNIVNVSLYDFMNDGINQYSAQDNFGLINSHLATDGTAYAPKVGYLALSGLCYAIAMMNTKPQLKDTTDDYIIYSCQGVNNKELEIVLPIYVNGFVNSYTLTKRAVIFDMYGNGKSYNANEEIYIQTPVYIQYTE